MTDNLKDKEPYTATIGNITIKEWNYELFLSKISEAKKKLNETNENNKEYLKG
mgnify:CR=1 FL=1